MLIIETTENKQTTTSCNQNDATAPLHGLMLILQMTEVTFKTTNDVDLLKM